MRISGTVSRATGLPGQRVDPYRAFNFLVEIEGLIVGGFSQVSGLESEVETTTYREGGLNRQQHVLPGPTSYPNLVLTRGLTDVDTLWRWYEDVTRGIVRRKHGTIMLLDDAHAPVMSWEFRDAYPVKWRGPQLDASTGTTVAIEQVELVHRGLRKSSAGRVSP